MFRWIGHAVLLLLLAVSAHAADIPSLDEQIGQMVMVGFRGASVNDQGVRTLARQAWEGDIGGVMLMDYNIRSGTQITALLEYLRSLPSPHPLFVSVDQEGGLVQRFSSGNGFDDYPAARDIAATCTPQQAYRTYRSMAAAIAKTGVNLNFGPVVDVEIDPQSPAIGRVKRSFSDNPATVTSYARQFIQAHDEAGIVTVIKHYPGHGSAVTDSHRGFTDVTDTWKDIELIPYESLIKSGKVKAVMSAHIFNKHLDASYPASLSEELIQKRLREQMDFDGVVITDDLQMRAITRRYSLEEAVVRAVQAGNDILLFGNFFDPDPFIARKVKQIIKDAVADGRIPAERVEQSYRRIVAMKETMGGKVKT